MKCLLECNDVVRIVEYGVIIQEYICVLFDLPSFSFGRRAHSRCGGVGNSSGDNLSDFTNAFRCCAW